jgi:hypothetical protein
LIQGSPRYYWESQDDNGFYNSQSFDDFCASLRMLNTFPSQIDNIGTEHPFPTNILPEDKFRGLLKILSRPIIVMTKLMPREDFPRKFNQRHGVLMDQPFLLEIGHLAYVLELREINNELNKIGCKLDDIVFQRQTPYGCTILEDNYKSYIANCLP